MVYWQAVMDMRVPELIVISVIVILLSTLVMYAVEHDWSEPAERELAGPCGYLYLERSEAQAYTCLQATRPKWVLRRASGFSSLTRLHATAFLESGGKIRIEGNWVWSPTPLKELQ